MKSDEELLGEASGCPLLFSARKRSTRSRAPAIWYDTAPPSTWVTVKSAPYFSTDAPGFGWSRLTTSVRVGRRSWTRPEALCNARGSAPAIRRTVLVALSACDPQVLNPAGRGLRSRPHAPGR